MPDVQELNTLWVATQARLPEGWSIDGLRCASTGLASTERSDEKVAVEIGSRPGSSQGTTAGLIGG